MTKKIPHVLIVDDDTNLLATMSDILTLKNFKPVTAQTGGEALEQLEVHNFELALIDLRLEDMSGLELLRGIKARSPETECILLTGHASQNSAIEAIQSGIYGYFQKPFDMDQVLLSIQRAMEKNATENTLRESERFAHATVDALSSHLAILDETGTILAVNRAWREFAKMNSRDSHNLLLLLNVAEGANYLSVCDTATGINSKEASAMAAGIRAVMSGKQKEFLLEYPCHSPEKKRWFIARVTRFPGAGPLRVAVTHENITERKQAEEALRESEEKYRLLIDQSPYAISIYQGGRLVFVNQAAISLLGAQSADELIGRQIKTFIHPDGINAARQRVRLMLQGEKDLYPVEDRYLSLDGSVVPVEVSATPLTFKGRPAIQVIALDITGRKQAEEKIRQTEKRSQALIENAPDGIVLINVDGKYKYVSPAALKIFNYKIEDILDHTPADDTHPDDLSMVLETLQNLLKNPSKTPTIQYRFKRQNGTWRWVESTFTNLLAEPSVESIVINFRDVTERKQDEEKLRESEERSRLAHDAAQLGTWQQNLATNIFHLDERARKHYDQDKSFLTTQEISERVHPNDKARLQAEITSILTPSTDGRLATEYRVIHRDGSIHWLSIYVRVHFEEHSGERQPIFATGTSQDITARKESEQKLIQRTQQLRLLNEATRKLNTSLKAEHVYEVIYASVSQLIQCDTLFISSFDTAQNMITLTGGWHDGLPLDLSSYSPIPLEPEGSGTQSQVIRSKKALLVPDFQARLKNTRVVHHFDGDGNPENSPPSEKEDIPRSALVVPLVAEDEVFGVIQVFSYRINAYTEDDLQILNGFSAQAAIALSNARLYENIQLENLERKRAEAALAESEKRFRSIYETSGLGIFEATPGGQIINVNSSYARIFGFESTEDAKQGIKDIPKDIYVHPEKHAEFVRYALEHPGMSSFENAYRRHDGSTFIGELKLQAMQNAEKQVTYLFGYVEDISERKQAEIEIKERTEELELINALNEAVNRGDSLNIVMEIFTKELRKIRLSKDSTIYMLSPDGKHLFMQHLGIAPTIVKKIEELIGRPIPQIQIPIMEGGYFQRALQSEDGIVTTDPKIIQEWMEEFTYTNFLPAAMRKTVGKLVPQIYKILDIHSTLIIPLVSDKKIIGLLDIASSGILTEKDLTRIKNISRQLTAVVLREQTNEALHESENRYRAIFDGVQDAIFVETKDGKISEVNNRACEIYGYSRSEFLKKTVEDLGLKEANIFPPTDISQKILHAPLETINRRANGELFPIEISRELQTINGEDMFLVIVRDITERLQAEENIHQRVKELELLYESGLVFSQLLNPKEIAQKIIELLGEKLNWHHTAIRLVHPQDESLELVAFDQPGVESQSEEITVQAHLNKLITGVNEGLTGWALKQSKIVRSGDVSSDSRYVQSFPSINSGLYVPLKSGDRRLGVISIESEKPDAFSQADEHLIATLANQAANAFENARLYEKSTRYAVELEERVQERTAEIESTRQRLELAVKTAGIGIWELDIKQNKDYWDAPLFALYGLTNESASASPITWHHIIHPDDLEQQLRLMDESLYHKQPYNTEFRVIWPDKSIHYIKSSGVVIYDAAGLPERMIGANQDISIDKQAEETLRLANAEMERGMRMKNEFLANMSHELRTPLNAILGISESLEEQIAGALNGKQLKYVRIISESGHHLLDLINDILDLSKIEAGKLEIDIQPISVEKLCSSSLRLVKELAQKKSLHISFKIDENAKIILGDERRLKQSLVNLLGNAVKFTPQGKKIGLEVRGDPTKNEINFTIWDEGIGINQEDIKLLFKPFVQLNAGFTREFAGTGLGLALVAQMVRMHGGRISLTSELKVGSRFIITLPWMPTEQAIQSPIKHQVLADNQQTKMKRTGKILLAEDTEVVAQLISEYLEHKGYEVIIAGNGWESVVLARQEHPQLILMDIMMPVMNGMDATRQIRADAALQNIPIIALTALAMPGDREQCIAAGMNDHISKPIQMQALAQIIERYLNPADESQTS